MSRKVNIYLIRGLTRESGHWGSFVETLQGENSNATIHLLDLPGSGKYFQSKSPMSVTGMVNFMRTFALPSIQDKSQAHIICATSLAGMVATEWVLNYPSDFDGLIMINSSFKGICTSRERAHPKMRMDMLRILFTSRNLEKRERLIVKVNSNKPELMESLTKVWVEIQKKRTMSRSNIFRQTFAGIRYSTNKRKPEIPLLIIGSKGDKLVSPECISKTHDFFGGTLVWHPTSGHGLPLDEPDWLSHEITNWIQSKKF